MKPYPSKQALRTALDAAWDAHKEYQRVYLNGVHDELWSGWYTAYVLGRLGDFVEPSKLSVWLEETPMVEDWVEAAAEYVLNKIGVLRE